MPLKKNRTPDYIPEVSQNGLNETTLQELTEWVDQIACLQKLKDEAEQTAKEIDTKIQTTKEVLRESMESVGLQQFATQGGAKARIIEHVSAKIEDSLVFYEDLKSRNEEGILNVALSGSYFEMLRKWLATMGRDVESSGVTVTCHHSRLRAYVKERGDDQVPGLKLAKATSVTVR